MHQYSVIITNKYEFFYSPVIGSENFLFSTGITITKDTCTSHQIRKVDIENVLLYMIQQVTAFAREHEDEFIELVTKSNAKSVGREIRESKKEFEQAQARISELDTIIQRLYEDNIEGKISDERFMKMSATYETEQNQLTERVAELEQIIDAARE